jgi:hypothetical protein
VICLNAFSSRSPSGMVGNLKRGRCSPIIITSSLGEILIHEISASFSTTCTASPPTI